MRLLGQLLFFGSFLAHIHCEEVFGIVGENFTFPVKIDRRIVEMTWKRNKNKVAEWEGESEATYYPSLRNRGLLNKENGCLTIYNLESSDNGTYELHYLATVEENYDLTFVLFVLGGSYNERSRGGLIAALVVFIPIAVILVFLCRRDKELNKEDSAQKDKQMVNNCVNQEDIFKEENSSLLSKHAADHGINEGEVTLDVEGGNGEHLRNSRSCSEEDLKS
ncbi:lymphocyte function-associated antigen 3 isoform X5 [Apus apus]|uniref:lymphocyte function-associated antigen 3 isoform X5 n=1 Tax=Apus apus TaxID=8895 RepID=UPI0021F8E710|nr:lymphocyte function-associated antigen 3 isoform X5 [Apus apus]